LGAGNKFKQSLWHFYHPNSDLLPDLPHTTGIVGLTRINMTGNRRIPQARAFLFMSAALLEKYLPVLPENKNVDSTMRQTQSVNIVTPALPDDLVLIINH
jgi:hypothetical protein